MTCNMHHIYEVISCVAGFRINYILMWIQSQGRKESQICSVILTEIFLFSYDSMCSLAFLLARKQRTDFNPHSPSPCTAWGGGEGRQRAQNR